MPFRDGRVNCGYFLHLLTGPVREDSFLCWGLRSLTVLVPFWTKNVKQLLAKPTGAIRQLHSGP